MFRVVGISDCGSWFKMSEKQLAGVAQWAGVSSRNQKVAGQIPGQATCLGSGLNAWSGHVQQTANRSLSHVGVSLPFPLPLSLK